MKNPNKGSLNQAKILSVAKSLPAVDMGRDPCEELIGENV